MRRLAALVLCLLAAACVPSRLDAGAQVTVSGKAQRGDGSSLAGSPAVMVKEPDLAEVLGGVLIVAGTAGLACLSEKPPAICSRARKVSTDAGGGFAYQLTGQETQGGVGEASYFDLTVKGPRAGAALDGPAHTERFVIQAEKLEVPVLRLWEPAVAPMMGAGAVAVTFDAPPAGTKRTGIRFEVGDAVIWEQDYQSGVAMDARLFEDAQGGVAATAYSDEAGSGSVFEHQLRSAKLPYQGVAGAPPSRGAKCLAVGASGVAVELKPCPLTDGDFAKPYQPPVDTGCKPDAAGHGCENARADVSVVVDLGAPRPASLLVVRGLWTSEILETSIDGSTWAPAVASTVGTAQAKLPAGAQVRYARVRAQTAGDHILGGLAELSVW
jgi:hypothetical protein